MSNHTNTEKSLEKSLGEEATRGPNATRVVRVSGDLNSTKGKNDGRTIDPENSAATGLPALAELTKEQNNPNLLGTMVGRWKAVVLKVDKACLVPLSSEIQLNEGEAVLPIMTIRARIPELDTVLPDPLTYGESQDKQALIELHRRFQASSVSQYTPSPGDIVWVELLNLDDNDDAGLYVGNLFEAPVGGGVVGPAANGSSGPFDNKNKLGVDAATGDGIGSVGAIRVTAQTPRVRSLEENIKRKHGPRVENSLAVLSPPVRALFGSLLGEIQRLGLPIKVFETTRTIERQRYIYTKGRNKKELIAAGITEWPPRPKDQRVTWTHNKSNHQDGLAIDFIFEINHPWWGKMAHGNVPPNPWDSTTPQAKAAWEEFGKLVNSLGFEWGGDFPRRKIDRPHVQLSKEQIKTLSS
jgi:hypothetical protein